MHFTRIVPALLFALSTVACGRSLEVKTPAGFVELDESSSHFAYRATTPEGVVIAARVVPLDDGHDDLDFWTKAITLELRDAQGYALIDARPIVSSDGIKGTQLTFGRDEASKPLLYRVGLFVKKGKLLLVEAGSTKAQYEKASASIDAAFASARFR